MPVLRLVRVLGDGVGDVVGDRLSGTVRLVVTVSVTVRGGDSVSEGDGLSCLSIADARRCLGGSKKIRVV